MQTTHKGGRVRVLLSDGLDFTVPSACTPLREEGSSPPGSMPEQQALLHRWHSDGDLITKPGKGGWSLTAWKAAKFQPLRRGWC